MSILGNGTPEGILEIVHQNDAEQGAFLAQEDGMTIGRLTYEWANEVEFVVFHTIVDPGHEGKGIARALVDAAARYARENGKRIRPVCPYVVSRFARHREYDDVNAENPTLV